MPPTPRQTDYQKSQIGDHAVMALPNHLELLQQIVVGARTPERLLYGGRLPHPVYRSTADESVVYRRYRRGGLIGKFLTHRYFRGHRSFHELGVLCHALERGVAVPRPIAAGELRMSVGYEAWIVTEYLPATRSLAEVAAKRVGKLEGVGSAIGAMHDAGIGHADLNANNILGAGGVEGRWYLIDFDRARRYPRTVPQARRRQDLSRLQRSLEKLGARLGEEAWSEIQRGYGSSWPLDRPSP